MENNVEVRTDTGPTVIGSLTAQAAPSGPNGDAFTASFACHSSANPFKDPLGDDSEDLFKNMVRQFGDELDNKAGKSDGSIPLNQSNDSAMAASYTQSRSDEDAAEFYAATQSGVTGLGTDEDKLFSVLEGKSPEDIEQLRQSFKDHYGQDLDTVINDELSGEDLSRAQALIKGEPAYEPEDLKQGLVADMNGWGTDEESIFERLAQATPEQRQSLRNDPELLGQLKSELSCEQFEQANGLLQGNSAKADAALIRQAMNGFLGADQQQVRDVLEGKSPEELNAIKAEYRQQTGQSLEDQVGQWSDVDADVTLRMLNPDAPNGAEASAERLKLAVNGLGTDENAIRNELAGKSKAEINRIADAYQQRYGQDLRSTLDSELDGRDEFEMLNQAFDQGAIDPNDPDVAQKQVDRLKARQDFEEGLGAQVLDTIQHWTKGKSDNDYLKNNLERAQNAIDAGQTDKAQRYAGYAQSDVKELQQSKDSVAETTATVATVAATTAVVIGTAGMAAPLAVAGMAAGTGVATRAGTYAALQGKAAGAQELSRQGAIGFVEGGIAAIPLGQGLGKGLSAAAETSENVVKAAAIQGAKEGFVQGAAGGGIDAATRSETWENGVMDGLGKVGTRATIDGTLSMATGSLSGAAIAGIKQKLGRSLVEIDTSVDKELDDVLDQAPNAASNQSTGNQLTDTTVDNISKSEIEIGGSKKTDVEEQTPELPKKEKVKTRGTPEEQLSNKGLNEPVPLTKKELANVRKWSANRNKYLKKWREKDLSEFPEKTQRLLQGSADRSIRKNMTPDDMAAVMKERRGVEILRQDGTPYKHLSDEWPNAKRSILNNIGREDRPGKFTGIKGRLNDLEANGLGGSKEASLLREKLGDLSNILDDYQSLLRVK